MRLYILQRWHLHTTCPRGPSHQPHAIQTPTEKSSWCSKRGDRRSDASNAVLPCNSCLNKMTDIMSLGISSKKSAGGIKSHSINSIFLLFGWSGTGWQWPTLSNPCKKSFAFQLSYLCYQTWLLNAGETIVPFSGLSFRRVINLLQLHCGEIAPSGI